MRNRVFYLETGGSDMWNYVKKYLYFAIPAALFMVGEVSMDLVQPGMMRRIVDSGKLGRLGWHASVTLGNGISEMYRNYLTATVGESEGK